MKTLLLFFSFVSFALSAQFLTPPIDKSNINTNQKDDLYLINSSGLVWMIDEEENRMVASELNIRYMSKMVHNEVIGEVSQYPIASKWDASPNFLIGGFYKKSYHILNANFENQYNFKSGYLNFVAFDEKNATIKSVATKNIYSQTGNVDVKHIFNYNGNKLVVMSLQKETYINQELLEETTEDFSSYTGFFLFDSKGTLLKKNILANANYLSATIDEESVFFLQENNQKEIQLQRIDFEEDFVDTLIIDQELTHKRRTKIVLDKKKKIIHLVYTSQKNDSYCIMLDCFKYNLKRKKETLQLLVGNSEYASMVLCGVEFSGNGNLGLLLNVNQPLEKPYKLKTDLPKKELYRKLEFEANGEKDILVAVYNSSFSLIGLERAYSLDDASGVYANGFKFVDGKIVVIGEKKGRIKLNDSPKVIQDKNYELLRTSNVSFTFPSENSY